MIVAENPALSARESPALQILCSFRGYPLLTLLTVMWYVWEDVGLCILKHAKSNDFRNF